VINQSDADAERLTIPCHRLAVAQQAGDFWTEERDLTETTLGSSGLCGESCSSERELRPGQHAPPDAGDDEFIGARCSGNRESADDLDSDLFLNPPVAGWKQSFVHPYVQREPALYFQIERGHA
jgi:hypothetical protein